MTPDSSGSPLHPEDENASARRAGPPTTPPFLPDWDHDLANLAEAARFPAENPNPVFRVAHDGQVLYANRASRPLMTAWGVVEDRCLPSRWRERVRDVLAAGVAATWDEPCDDRLLQLHCVPVADSGYVNIYASDVTERTALVAELARERRQLAEAARTSALRVQELEALLALLPVGIAICYDPDGKDIRVNPANARLLGMPPGANVSLGTDEARVQPPYRVFDLAGREMAVEELPVQAALRGAEVRDRVVDIVRGDETRVTLLSYAAPLPDSSGSARGAVAAFIDVSELHAAQIEQARLLRELEARHAELRAQAGEIQALNAELEQRVTERTAELEAIFASVPDAIYVANESGILRCNQAALDGFGCERVEELQGGLAATGERIQPRDPETGRRIPVSEQALARALRGERPVIEVVTRNPKSNRDRTWRVAAGPVVVNGATVAAVGVAVDITEQKRAEMQNAYHANLLARINDAVIAIDLDQRITSWNHAAEDVFGWSEAETLGRLIGDILPTEFVNISFADVLRQMAEQGRWRGEMIVTRRDGGRVHVEATGVPLRDAHGRVIGQVGVNRDVTAQKQAEAESARLLEELRLSHEQLHALSHRLVIQQEAERSYVADQLYNRTGQVLAALQFQLARLARTGDSLGDQALAINATLSEAIHALHDLASELRPASLDRAGLGRALESLVEAFGERDGLAVVCDLGGLEGLRPSTAVITAVYRAVQEGLANVARHARATEVRLTLRREGDVLVVTLADNGNGFNSALAAQATGLGLASIRELLETAGGELAIVSGSDGTTLQIRAPL